MLLKVNRRHFFPVYEWRNEVMVSYKTILGFHKFVMIDEKVDVPEVFFKFRMVALEINLRNSEEQILSGFSKQLRNCVRQGEKLGFSCFSNNDVQRFLPFFNAFARKKNLSPLKKETIDQIGENGVFTFIEYEGSLLSAHYYIRNPGTGSVSLYKSASARLDRADLEPNFVGKANKYLHYWDMNLFKSQGYLNYEFGGYDYSGPKEVLFGVNNFKKMFGGTVNNYMVYQSYPYYLFERSRRFFSEIRKKFDKKAFEQNTPA